MKILLVEDDQGLAQALQITLTRQHYLVDLACDGQMGWEFAEGLSYDLILLDLRLPKLDGITLCKRLRTHGNRTPILLMTAQNSSTQKVEGLDAGADDYLVKPFEMPELLARVRALLRRSADTLPPVLEWGELRLDPSNCQVTYQGRRLKLTAKEYELLEILLRHPHRIFSQSALLDHLWSFDDPPSETAVRTQIKGLRQKLKQAGAQSDLIETVYGLGYRFKPNTQLPLPPPQLTSPQPETTETLNLSRVWKKHRESYLQRVTFLEQALKALEDGCLEAVLERQALEQAHTLAGSLGSFGFGQASQYCRQIEQILQEKQQLPQHIIQLSELIIAIHKELDVSPSPLLSASVFEGEPAVTAANISSVPPAEILIVDDDVALAQAIAVTLRANQMHPKIANSPEQARNIMQHNPPDAILLDLSFPESTEAGFEFLQQLNSQSHPPPVIVFTAKQSFADRVKVARLGGRGFLHKPIDPPTVIETLVRVLSPPPPVQAKLLIVNHEPEILDHLRLVLEPWGFDLTLLDDPQQFWPTLKESTPDVVLLDLAMPNFSGLDLCQVIRNDPQWQTLPVLILLSQRDAKTVGQVFMVGADDYIQKPIVEPELIARLVNCLERSQLYPPNRNEQKSTSKTKSQDLAACE